MKVYSNLDKKWYTVCSAGWNKGAADKACKQLGFLKGAQRFYDVGANSLGTEVAFGAVTCKGNEKSIQQCEHSGWKAPTACADKNKGAVGLKCIGSYYMM